MPNSVSSDLFSNLIGMVIENYSIGNPSTLKHFQEGVAQFTAYVFLQDPLIDQDLDWVKESMASPNILVKINMIYRSAIFNLTRCAL